MDFKDYVEECMLYVKANFPKEEIKLSGEPNKMTLTFRDCEFYGNIEEVFKEFFEYLQEDDEDREYLNNSFRKGWDLYQRV